MPIDHCGVMSDWRDEVEIDTREYLTFYSVLLLLDVLMLQVNGFNVGTVVDLLPLAISASRCSCCGWSKFRTHINEHVQG